MTQKSTSDKKDIKDLTYNQLVSWLESKDIKSYRAGQILKWIYLHQADQFDEMTDISNDIRLLLVHDFTINRLEKVSVKQSIDGTKKYLFRLTNGEFIETVLIPEKGYSTLCISSQVGCAQGCRFCLTAKGGFIRNLTTGEIISQVRDIKKDIKKDKKLSNIVFMGMGEPLANYKNLINAINIFTNQKFGLSFSPRRITVSTAGLSPRLSDLWKDSKVNLAVSLNATDNKTRDALMPINRKYPIEVLLEECRNSSLFHHRKITFEYILIKGVNDSENDANRLAALLRPIKAKINLIPFNEHESIDYLRPSESVINRFRDILAESNYTTIIRHSKGQDISAACGQLRYQEKWVMSQKLK